jgi:hypothetical protein
MRLAKRQSGAPLSEAERQQRREAARARWAEAARVGGGALAAGALGWSAPSALLAPRSPTKAEARKVWKTEMRGVAGALKREGADIHERAAIMRGVGRSVMRDVMERLRPVGNRRAQAAAAVATGLLGGALAARGARLTQSRPAPDAPGAVAHQRRERENKVAQASMTGSLTGLGIYGGVRSALAGMGRRPLAPHPAFVAAAATGVGVLNGLRVARKES